MREDILKEAQYVHRGEDSKYNLDDIGQCGMLPCDHSELLKDNSGEEHRFCNKLQISVETFDSCKYHSDEKVNALCLDAVGIINNKNMYNEEEHPQKKTKRSIKGLVPIIVIAAICILFIIWNF